MRIGYCLFWSGVKYIDCDFYFNICRVKEVIYVRFCFKNINRNSEFEILEVWMLMIKNLIIRRVVW